MEDGCLLLRFIERMDLTARGAGKRIHAIIVQEASGMRKSLMTRYKK
jgi:hypothetical protein